MNDFTPLQPNEFVQIIQAPDSCVFQISEFSVNKKLSSSNPTILGLMVSQVGS